MFSQVGQRQPYYIMFFMIQKHQNILHYAQDRHGRDIDRLPEDTHDFKSSTSGL